MRLLLVDALNLIRRIYAAHPAEEGPERAAGALDSSVRSLERALRESSPTHAACVFDGEGPSWRHELLPAYKAGHPPMPAQLLAALEDFRGGFRGIGVASLSIAGFEADDVIATAAVKATAAGAAAIVLSTDKSFLQLLPAGVYVRDHFRRLDSDAARVRGKFGVGPEQLVDLLALTGDRGNGIAGVPGIGIKTAARLLGRFGTLERLLESATDDAAEPPPELRGKLRERLREHADAARLCRRLLALRTDLELGINLSELRCRPPSDESLG